MYQKLEYIVGTHVLDLTDGEYSIEDYEDFGLADYEFPTEQSPDQHGVTEYDEFYLKPRLVKLVADAWAEDREVYDYHRQNLLRILGPRRRRGALRVTKDSGKVYQLDCRLIEGLKGNTSDRFGFTQRDVLVFRAAWPCWYDPDLVNVQFSLGIGGDRHTVPLTVPHGFGASQLNHQLTIHYDGTFAAYPVITIEGPVTGPRVVNLTTGDAIVFKPTASIGASQSYTIDTRSSYLVVKDQAGAIRTHELDEAQSDLVSFHIASVREETEGINTLYAEGQGANQQTRIIVAYHTQYDGI